MYRLNYPKDPGMHNSWHSHQHKTVPRLATTILGELKSYWLSVTFYVIVGSFAGGLHYFNERQVLQTNLAVEESLRSIRKLTTSNIIFEENNNKLVYLVGKLTTDEELSDPEYDVSIKAVKLRRRYEMYQWVEEKVTEEVDDGDHSKASVSYSYYKTWHNNLIESDLFSNPIDYQNPKSMPKNFIETAEVVKVGNFILSKRLLDKINNFQPFTGHTRPQTPGLKLHAGLYYHSNDVWKPQIGDIRVEFARAGLADEDHGEIVTIIAKQEGRMLSPYLTQSGDEVLILHFGRKTPEDVIHVELAQSKWRIWIIRIASLLILTFVTNGLLSVLESLMLAPSVLRDVLRLGTTYVTICVTVTFYALILGCVSIWNRPLTGSIYLVISMVPFLLLCIKLYRRDRAENLQHRRA